MRSSFPVVVNAVYTGKCGDGGTFTDTETGEAIPFSEAHAFDYDSADGNVQRLVLRANKIDQVAEAGCDVAKLRRYVDQVRIEGDVVLNTEGRSYFRPSKVAKAASAVKAA
jgi:hypothetical protein